MGDDVTLLSNHNSKDSVWSAVLGVEGLLAALLTDEWWDVNTDGSGLGMIPSCSDREESCVGLEIRGINNNNNNVKLSHLNPSYLLKPSQLYTLSSIPAPQELALCKLSLLKTVNDLQKSTDKNQTTYIIAVSLNLTHRV